MDISVRQRSSVEVPTREPLRTAPVAPRSMPTSADSTSADTTSLPVKPHPAPAAAESSANTSQLHVTDPTPNASPAQLKSAPVSPLPAGTITLTILAMIGLSAVAIVIYLQS